MHRSVFLARVAGFAAVALATAGVASADTISFGRAPVVRANGDLLSSNNGLTANGFTTVTDESGASIALRARSRSNNNAIVGSQGSYQVLPGFYNPTTPEFYLEYQFTPVAGTNDADYANYSIRWEITGPNGLNYVDQRNASYWRSTDGFQNHNDNENVDGVGEYGSKPNQTDDWIDLDGNDVNDIPFVVVNSWQLPWFAGMPDNYADGIQTGEYDPSARGTYTVTATVFSGSNEVLSNTISVTAVPEPMALLGGGALLGLIGARRRR